MPPFGAEKDEPSSKPLPFLNFKSHDSSGPVAAGKLGPFGVEAAESMPGRSRNLSVKPSRRFEGGSHASLVPVLKRPSETNVLWGEEPAESEDVGKASDSSSSGESENAYRGTSRTVFSMGWHSILDLKRATFWNEKASQPAQKKRRYNNTGRAAAASYARKNIAGFKQNGLDPKRLEGLTGSTQCQCFLV